jgi:hypothetical protein
MIDVPVVMWEFTAAHAAAALGMFVVGLLSHELMHIGACVALGIPRTVDVLPGGLRGALFGTLVDVRLDAMPERWQVAVVMLAPAVMAVPPLAGYAIALSAPAVRLGVLAVFGLWFIAAIPGLWDIVTVATYRPDESVPTEVAA